MRMIVFAVVVAVGLYGAVWKASAVKLSLPSQQKLTKDDVDRLMNELSNWGRWGKEDEIGAINLITPAKRKQAAALVKEGFSVSLAGDADTVKAVDNPFPY